jgi:sugar lactone lactonase YvrE
MIVYRRPLPKAAFFGRCFVTLATVAIVHAPWSDAVSGDRIEPRVEYTVYATGLAGPRGLLIAPSGDLYAVEQSGGRFVKITRDGKVALFAEGFSNPHDLALDASGYFYVADTGANRVARVSPGGVVTPYITGLEEPVDLAFHPDGELFVCELGAGRVTAFRSSRKIRVVASGLAGPHGLAFDRSGVTYINEWSGNRIVKISRRGDVEAVAEVEDPVGIAVGISGDLYVTQPQAGKVSRIRPVGTRITLLEGLNGPRDPVFDAAGNLYVVETGAGRILRITGDF